MYEDIANRLNELVSKWQKNDLTYQEAEELKKLLEKEKKKAKDDGDNITTVATGFLLGMVVGYLANEKSTTQL